MTAEGWTVRDSRGQIRLCVRYEDGSGAVKPSHWREKHQPVMQQVLAVLSAQPRPVNSWVLLERLVEAHGGDPGSLKPFVGGRGRELTTPIKDHEVVRLLAGLENAKWRTAVALVACFGLRGVGLATSKPGATSIGRPMRDSEQRIADEVRQTFTPLFDRLGAGESN
jgi:hypothetical protein